MNAPIVIFAYNRPDHLRKTLTALSKNDLAKESAVYVYIDGPKNEQGKELNQRVFQVAKDFQENYFLQMHISCAEINRGLARSVIEGVTKVINQYEKVIVVEDDSLTDCNYLSFMNQALEVYKENERIFSIGGYTVPLKLPSYYDKDVILTQRSSSYAWATWKNRWDTIDWSVKDYKSFRWNFRQRRKFNRWGKDRASMLDDQINGRVNSWAIRFDYAMFKQKSYNILPSKSLVQNIGHDGSGTHSSVDQSKEDSFFVELSKERKTFALDQVEEDEKIRREFGTFFATGAWALFKRFISNLLYRKRGNCNGNKNRVKKQ